MLQSEERAHAHGILARHAQQAAIGIICCIVLLTVANGQLGTAVAHPAGDGPLKLDVYVADDKAYNVTSTLIYGKSESLLVDAQFHLSDASKLADQIAATHTHLRAIFITHPDLDHYIGLAALHQRFPDAPIYMTRRALEEFNKSVASDLESAPRRAPQETPNAVPTPQVLPSTRLAIDGQTVVIVEDQQGDFATQPANSFLYVPCLRAVIAGDIVFSGIHPWLEGSTSETRRRWRASLALLKALQPEIVVAGHGLREPETTAAAITFMERYLADFEALRSSSPNADQFVTAMQGKYPTLGQLLFLKIAARSVFAKPSASGSSHSGMSVAEARHAIEQGYVSSTQGRSSIWKNSERPPLASW